jgi:hypothetical protein
VVVNIISKSLFKGGITGPSKVVKNTVNGLKMLGVECVYNQPISKYKNNWIHDNKAAVIEAGFCNKPVIIGPNIATAPDELPIFRKKLHKNSIFLIPSKWVVDLWSYFEYHETDIKVWPAGIDTDEFSLVERKSTDKILLYFKQRDVEILHSVKEILVKYNFNYELICYGEYKQEDYVKALHNCSFGIWIGCSESQGIGLQEALATNMPLIVLDVKTIFDTFPIRTKKYIPYSFPKGASRIRATSAPYFDERCGIIVNNINELQNKITEFSLNVDKYSPRAYIMEKLSLKISAGCIVVFFKNINLKKTNQLNFRLLSFFLFYLGLLFQKIAWKRIWHKINPY